MRLFRIVPERDSPSFGEAFRSHYELGRLPRGPENRAAAIHMALSMFDERSVAAQLAARVPKLGGHIAEMALEPDLGICIAPADQHTGPYGPSTSTHPVRGRA